MHWGCYYATALDIEVAAVVLFKTKQKYTKQNRSENISSGKIYFTSKGQIRILSVCVIAGSKHSVDGSPSFARSRKRGCDTQKVHCHCLPSAARVPRRLGARRNELGWFVPPSRKRWLLPPYRDAGKRAGARYVVPHITCPSLCPSQPPPHAAL